MVAPIAAYDPVILGRNYDENSFWQRLPWLIYVYELFIVSHMAECRKSRKDISNEKDFYEQMKFIEEETLTD